MALKKLGAVLSAALVLGAFFAASSHAMVLEVGETKFTNGQTETFKIKEIGMGTIVTKILGTPFKKTHTGLELVEGKLVQNGTTVEGTGKIRLTGVTIDEPAGCKTTSTIESNPIRGVVAHGNTAETKSGLYIKFAPVSGEVFATITIKECAAAGTYPLKGVEYGKMSNPTGVLSTKTEVSFSETINKTQGGSLLLGKEPAVLTALGEGELAGANAGKAWRLTE
jgi:hypothetical protein